MKNNLVLRDILIILALSVILALWFNFMGNPEGLSLIREKQEVAMADDSEFLIEGTSNQSAADTIVPFKDTIPVKKADTVAISKVEPPKTIESTAPAKAKSITYKQVLQLLKDPKVLVIDARNEHEFAEGHLPRARNIFAMEFEQHIPELIGLDKDVRVIVYCGGGQCELSHEVSNNMIGLGFKKVYIYLGGWDDWNKNGAGK